MESAAQRCPRGAAAGGAGRAGRARDARGSGARGQGATGAVSMGLTGCCKNVFFYSERNGKLSQGFRQRRDMLCFPFFKHLFLANSEEQ